MASVYIMCAIFTFLLFNVLMNTALVVMTVLVVNVVIAGFTCMYYCVNQHAGSLEGDDANTRAP